MKYIRFGSYLKSLRKREHKTLKQVADFLGYSTSYICDIEKGRRSPFKTPDLKKLIKFFDCQNNIMLEIADRESYMPKYIKSIYCKHEDEYTKLLLYTDSLPEDKFKEFIDSIPIT